MTLERCAKCGVQRDTDVMMMTEDDGLLCEVCWQAKRRKWLTETYEGQCFAMTGRLPPEGEGKASPL